MRRIKSEELLLLVDLYTDYSEKKKKEFIGSCRDKVTVSIVQSLNNDNYKLFLRDHTCNILLENVERIREWAGRKLSDLTDPITGNFISTPITVQQTRILFDKESFLRYSTNVFEKDGMKYSRCPVSNTLMKVPITYYENEEKVTERSEFLEKFESRMHEWIKIILNFSKILIKEKKSALRKEEEDNEEEGEEEEWEDEEDGRRKRKKKLTICASDVGMSGFADIRSNSDRLFEISRKIMPYDSGILDLYDGYLKIRSSDIHRFEKRLDIALMFYNSGVSRKSLEWILPFYESAKSQQRLRWKKKRNPGSKERTKDEHPELGGELDYHLRERMYEIVIKAAKKMEMNRLVAEAFELYFSFLRQRIEETKAMEEKRGNDDDDDDDSSSDDDDDNYESPEEVEGEGEDDDDEEEEEEVEGEGEDDNEIKESEEESEESEKKKKKKIKKKKKKKARLMKEEKSSELRERTIKIFENFLKNREFQSTFIHKIVLCRIMGEVHPSKQVSSLYFFVAARELLKKKGSEASRLGAKTKAENLLHRSLTIDPQNKKSLSLLREFYTERLEEFVAWKRDRNIQKKSEMKIVKIRENLLNNLEFLLQKHPKEEQLRILREIDDIAGEVFRRELVKRVCVEYLKKWDVSGILYVTNPGAFDENWKASPEYILKLKLLGKLIEKRKEKIRNLKDHAQSVITFFQRDEDRNMMMKVHGERDFDGEQRQSQQRNRMREIGGGIDFVNEDDKHEMGKETEEEVHLPNIDNIFFDEQQDYSVEGDDYVLEFSVYKSDEITKSNRKQKKKKKKKKKKRKNE